MSPSQMDGSDLPQPQPAGLSDLPQSTSMESARKRRRISLACAFCRARKSRCDGVRPKCSACEGLNLECSYVQLGSGSGSGSNVIVGKDYLKALEDRLKAVEETLTSRKIGQESLQRCSASCDGRSGEIEDHPNGVSRALGPDQTGVEVNRDDLQDSSGLEDEADGMGAIQFSTEADCSFFGPSSNIAFTRQLFKAVARVSNKEHIWDFSGQGSTPGLTVEGGIMSISRPSSPPGRSCTTPHPQAPINIYALPCEEDCRRLVSQYFSETGLLFPYIHQGTFMGAYEEMKHSNFKKVRRTWLALLNIIMALATSTVVEIGLSCEKRIRDSEVYYQRAIGLCGMQITCGVSIETVQYLLVLGQYLQGTQRSIETWTVHGIAVKAAFQLGLHSANIAKRLSPLEQEIRKRTWFGCIVLDRTLSMTFGRPATIPNDYIKMELPQHIDGWTYEDDDELRTSSSVAFFSATMALYKIMWNAIHLSYGDNIDCDGHTPVFDIVSQVFQTEQQLAGWRQTLPACLPLYQPTSIPCDVAGMDSVMSNINKFRIILTLRHNNIRILMHRPILVKFLETAGEPVSGTEAQDLHLLRQIGSNSIQNCVQCAVETIAIVKILVTATDSRRSWLGAWWFTLYYTFNATLILLASLLVVQDQTKGQATAILFPMSILELRDSVTDAVVAMQWLDSGNRMADKCAGYIRQLSCVLDALISGRDGRDYGNSLDDLGSVVGNFNDGWLPAFPGDVNLHASPLGPQLGEFMLDGDIEFLNQLAAVNTNKVAGLANELSRESNL